MCGIHRGLYSVYSIEYGTISKWETYQSNLKVIVLFTMWYGTMYEGEHYLN